MRLSYATSPQAQVWGKAMRPAEHDAQKVAFGKDSARPRLDATNSVHWEEGIPRTMAHPECAWRDGSYDVIDVTHFQQPGKVRREIVRDPVFLHGSEGAEATGREGHAHAFVVEGVPQCGLAAERVADHPQASGIHAVVAPNTSNACSMSKRYLAVRLEPCSRQSAKRRDSCSRPSEDVSFRVKVVDA